MTDPQQTVENIPIEFWRKWEVAETSEQIDMVAKLISIRTIKTICSMDNETSIQSVAADINSLFEDVYNFAHIKNIESEEVVLALRLYADRANMAIETMRRHLYPQGILPEEKTK